MFNEGPQVDDEQVLVPLTKIPFPLPILIFAAITIIAFLAGLARMPQSISMGLRYERGRQALDAGKWTAAIEQWYYLTREGTPAVTKILGMPIVGLIYIGALGSIFWLHITYGVAVAALLPDILIRLFA